MVLLKIPAIKNYCKRSIILKRYLHMCTKFSRFNLRHTLSAQPDKLFIQFIGKNWLTGMHKAWTVTFSAICI